MLSLVLILPSNHPFSGFHALFAIFYKFGSCRKGSRRNRRKVQEKFFFCCSQHLLFRLPSSPLLSFHFFPLVSSFCVLKLRWNVSIFYCYWSSFHSSVVGKKSISLPHFSVLITVSNRDERIARVLVHHGVVFLSFHASMSDFSFLICLGLRWSSARLPDHSCLTSAVSTNFSPLAVWLTAWATLIDLHICIKLQRNLLNCKGTHTYTHTPLDWAPQGDRVSPCGFQLFPEEEVCFACMGLNGGQTAALMSRQDDGLMTAKSPTQTSNAAPDARETDDSICSNPRRRTQSHLLDARRKQRRKQVVKQQITRLTAADGADGLQHAGQKKWGFSSF